MSWTSVGNSSRTWGSNPTPIVVQSARTPARNRSYQPPPWPSRAPGRERDAGDDHDVDRRRIGLFLRNDDTLPRRAPGDERRRVRLTGDRREDHHGAGSCTASRPSSVAQMRSERPDRSGGRVASSASSTAVHACRRWAGARSRSVQSSRDRPRNESLVRRQAVPHRAGPFPHRRHDRHRHATATARRIHDRLVHVGVARSADGRLPADDHERHLGGDRALRAILRQRARRGAGRPVLEVRQDRRRGQAIRRRRLVPGRRPARRSSIGPLRGSTAWSSGSTRWATTYFVLGRVVALDADADHDGDGPHPLLFFKGSLGGFAHED